MLLLRRVGDSDAIRERIERGARFVVIGGGWIGAEVAATARSGGCEVAMVFPEDVPLERVLGTEFGGIFGRLHETNGVELYTGAGIAALEGSGSVERVRLADGRSLDADAVVVGIGVAPRVELAEQAGLALSNGIDVDSRFRTSDESIWAAGDVAAVEHAFFGERIRVEHWAVANDHGPFAAKSMLGSEDDYDTLPYFFSDQFDASLEYWGFAREWDEVVIRGDEQSFVAFWLKDGRVLAGAGYNSPGVGEAIEELIRSRETGRPDRARRSGHAARCRCGGAARGQPRRGRRDRAGRRLARDRPGRRGQSPRALRGLHASRLHRPLGSATTSSGSATATARPTRSTARSSTGRRPSRCPSAR